MSDVWANSVFRAPALEPAFVSVGKIMNRMPLIDTLYRRAVETYANKIKENNAHYRKINPGPLEMSFDVTHFTTQDYYFKGVLYEPRTTQLILTDLAGSKTFIDIGANTGYFTLMAALLVGKEGKVYAFEPNPDMLKELRNHIALNSVETQVVISECALSDGAQQDVDFFISNCPTNNGLSSLTPSQFALDHGMLSLNRKIVIQTETFDQWAAMAKLGPVIDLIKIDVEGAEEKVLRGMLGTLSNHPPAKIICETEWNSPAHGLLRDFGYNATPLDMSVAGFGNILFTRNAVH